MVSHYLYDNFLKTYFTRTNCSIFICFLGFILGLPFVTNGGFYLFELVDNYATLISLFTILLMQAYMTSYYIGIEVVQEIIANKTGKVIPQYVFFSIKYISPVAISVLIFFSLGKAVNIIILNSFF